MKFAIFIIALLSFSFVAAAVETSSSGVFRGSLRHTITLDGEDELLNVKPGDYLAFKLPGETYTPYQKYEEKEIYVKSYFSEKAIYDLPLDKFNEISYGESVALDLTDDGVDDVMLRFEEGNRWVASLPCKVACSSDEDCSGECVDAGTCDAFCAPPAEPEAQVCCKALIASCLSCVQNVTEEEYCAENPDTVGCPEQELNETESEEVTEENETPQPPEQKGWFSRVLAWFAGLV